MIITMKGFTGHKELFNIPVNRFATTTEAAEMLGITRQSVLKAIKKEKLRYLRTKYYYILIEDILEYKRLREKEAS